MYETNWWGVGAAYDSLRGGAGAFAGLISSGMKDDRLSVNGYMLLSNTKLGAGWLRRQNDGSATPLSDIWYGGVSHDITPAFNLAGQVYYLRYHESANEAWLAAVRSTYAFSKRSSTYLTAGYIDNRGQLALSVSGGAPGSNPQAGGNQFGAMIGMKHTF